MSQRLSGVLNMRLMVLVCPANLRTGKGARPPGFSVSAHTRMSPRLLPAARRLGPTKLTAVTQSASQGKFQAGTAFSRDWEKAGEYQHAIPRSTPNTLIA